MDDNNQGLCFNEKDGDYLENLAAASQDSEYNENAEFEDNLSDPDTNALEEVTEISYAGIDGPDFKQLPPHACRYCGIHDVDEVVMCKQCDRWFCNGKGFTTGAHILQHMIRAQHKEIILHKDSALGDSELECYQCGVKNLFLLGFVPSKNDNVIVVLCRNCSSMATKSANWCADEWHCLIEDRALLPWLAKVPSQKDRAKSFHITSTQMRALEELWRQNPSADFSDLNKPGIDEVVEPVQQTYKDAYNYRRILNPLIRLEAEYDKAAKEALTQTVSNVKWDTAKNRKILAIFQILELLNSGIKLMIGDELKLKHNQTILGVPWECKGHLIKVPDHHSEDFILEFDESVTIPTVKRINYIVEFIWNATSYNRMYCALDTLAQKPSCVSPFIYRKLMGHHTNESQLDISLPKKFSAPGLPELNHSQVTAVRQALRRPLSLIQGPPGTGKTVTSATLIYHLVNQTKGKVLVCAPSNIAVDQLAEKLHKTGLKVIRLCAKGREDVQSPCAFLSLHNQLKSLTQATELQSLLQLKETGGGLSFNDENRLKLIIKSKEKVLLSKADVICCTCVCAADARITFLKFKAVLIDECSQATEPEIMVPVTKAKNQLVLVGDHCQLGPVVMCEKANSAGFSQTLFERLMLNGNIPIRLQVQYRMHPAMSAFPSNVFYEGSLQNGVTAADRVFPDSSFHWPVPNKPIIFWHTDGTEELSPTGTSFLNRTEAINVELLATKFLNAGVTPDQIGIITPYGGQRAYIVQHMNACGTLHYRLYNEIEVANVDAFQGREKDIVIVSCVRSNENNGIGFLSDPRRLNVALTRAKYGLVIIGNGKVLSKNILWNHLLLNYRDQGCLMDGHLNNLKPSGITLPKERSLNEFFKKHTRFVSPALSMTEPVKLQTIDLTKSYNNSASLMYNQFPNSSIIQQNLFPGYPTLGQVNGFQNAVHSFDSNRISSSSKKPRSNVKNNGYSKPSRSNENASQDMDYGTMHSQEMSQNSMSFGDMGESQVSNANFKFDLSLSQITRDLNGMMQSQESKM
uniref:Regulator of nonsense transcripts 1 n=1 Tax=Rhabditophanes sp. KR3021 TaxID=114890 RepID=A0AC35TGV9_9BILA